MTRKPIRRSKNRRAARTSASRRKPIDRVREICLALPDALEKEAWGGPTFRAAHGMFAMYVDDHHGDGILGIWVKAPPGLQEMLIGSDPKRYFRPPYVGHQGWVGMRLEGAVDWKEVANLLHEGHAVASTKQRIPRVKRSGSAKSRDAMLRGTTDFGVPIPARWE
ncbi:MAG: MmcQ/YjbR family DNA-binding protein [Candidatus Binataceae bacterium]